MATRIRATITPAATLPALLPPLSDLSAMRIHSLKNIFKFYFKMAHTSNGIVVDFTIECPSFNELIYIFFFWCKYK